jgi:flagellar motor protein MotB
VPAATRSIQPATVAFAITSAAFLILAAYLFIRTADQARALATEQEANRQLLDEKRIRDATLSQLQNQHTQNEKELRETSKALSASEQQRMAAELARLKMVEAQAARKKMALEAESTLRNAVGTDAATVIPSGDSITIRLTNKILFASGEVALRSNGMDALRAVAKLLDGPLKDFPVSIEGHTDNVPVSDALKPRYPSNWELSAQRAGTAVRFLQTECGIDPQRLRAIGRADTVPVAANDTDDDRAQNRRLDIIVDVPDLQAVAATPPAPPSP